MFTDNLWHRATVLSSSDGMVFTVAFFDAECEEAGEIDPREDVVRVSANAYEKLSLSDVCGKDSDGSTCDSQSGDGSLADFDDSSSDEWS